MEKGGATMGRGGGKMTRPSFDEWGLGIADAVATRGDCTRRQVGAVILDLNHRVLSVGYNGVAPGRAGCLDGVCPRATSGVAPGSSYDTGKGSCISTHAEANALLYSDPLRRAGGVMYISTEPCDGCARLIRASGLARCVWPEGDWTL
jgi:dCMP deaminase